MGAATAVAKQKRGPSYQMTEDLVLCKAFIATSEDPVVGTNQRSGDFKNKFHLNYVSLIREYNDGYGTAYGDRNGLSALNRFKKMSRFVLKFIGTEESAGDPPSGDTGREEHDKLVKETYLSRYPEAVNMVEAVIHCKDFLINSPKWRTYQQGEEESAETKKRERERPVGTKKAKEKKADHELVRQCLSVAESVEKPKKKKLRQKKEEFMTKVGASLDVVVATINATLEEQNDLKFLSMCSPKSKKKLQKEMFHAKMRKLRGTENRVLKADRVLKASSKTSNLSVNSPLTIDLESSNSSSNSDSNSSMGDSRPSAGLYRDSNGDLLGKAPMPQSDDDS